MSYVIRRYISCDIPPKIKKGILEFLFKGEEKNKEVGIYLQYLKQAITYIALDGENVIGTVRLILKRNERESLPIEAAQVVQNLDLRYKEWFLEGKPFQITRRSDALPSAEIGGLQLSNEISYQDRYSLLQEIFSLCARELETQSCKWAFITCSDSVAKLYTRTLFYEAAVINYGDRIQWKVLIRKATEYPIDKKSTNCKAMSWSFSSTTTGTRPVA